MNPSIATLRPGFVKSLTRHRAALIGGIVLVSLYTGCIFADFIAPYHYETEARGRNYQPPTWPKFFDGEGNFHLIPVIPHIEVTRDEHNQPVYREDPSRWYPIRFFVRGDRHQFLFFETDIHLFGIEAPTDPEDPEYGVRPMMYLIGADSSGRDTLSRLLYGSRISLSIGLVALCITFPLGMFLGGVAGYFGGKVDLLLQRFFEMVMLFPGFYLLLTLRGVVPAEWSSTATYFAIILILCFLDWAGIAIVIRGMTLSLREQEFSTAARALGSGPFRIITKHLLPNTLSYAIVAATVRIPGYMLAESALSMLGLGIQPPEASWGNMLQEGMKLAHIVEYPWLLVPGFAIFVAVMAFNFLGDGLRDVLDPRGLSGPKKI